MIYFRVLNPTKPKEARLGGIAKKELPYYMKKYPNETFLTDEVTMAEVTVDECYGDSIYVRVNGYEGNSPFKVKIYSKDFVSMATSENWSNGRYVGNVKLIKAGEVCLVKPVLN